MQGAVDDGGEEGRGAHARRSGVTGGAGAGLVGAVALVVATIM